MSKDNSASVVPNSPIVLASEEPTNTPTPSGLSVVHVLPAIAFPVIGVVLYIVGMPDSDILPFLLGCAGIGVMVTITVTGGRRLATAAAHAVLALTSTK
ncbi:hypothetical protein ACFT7U_10930 [Streptomyces rochei]|uniref:hypothetical protein n=1 Tax=Streptomyces rochei TaxID=1928 RepID=UPI00362FE561